MERRFVALATSRIYSDKIIVSVLCLFDTRRGFLVQEYIPVFEAMNHEDLLEFQQSDEDENFTKRRKRDIINE